jgi:hypothetical protein
MTYRILAIAALVCTPALAQAPPQLETTPLLPSATPVKAVRSSTSSEPATAERQVFGWSGGNVRAAAPSATPVQAVRTSTSSEPATAERQVFGWSARNIMGAAPAEPVLPTAVGVDPSAIQPTPMRLPSTRNDTPNGGPN